MAKTPARTRSAAAKPDAATVTGKPSTGYSVERRKVSRTGEAGLGWRLGHGHVRSKLAVTSEVWCLLERGVVMAECRSQAAANRLLDAMTKAAAPIEPACLDLPEGWRFQRNKDGSIGIFAPQPLPGEARRTSGCVYPSVDRDLHELLSKLVDHTEAAQAVAQATQQAAPGVRKSSRHQRLVA